MQEPKPKGPPRGTKGGRTPKNVSIGNRIKKSLMIDPDILDEMQKLADERGVSLSDVVNEILRTKPAA